MSERSAIRVSISSVVMPLIPDFLEARAEDAVRIPALADARDYAEVRRLGHNMKGNGGAYGFVFITEIGAEIERAAHDEDGSKANAAAARLSDYLTRVIVVAVDQ